MSMIFGNFVVMNSNAELRNSSLMASAVTSNDTICAISTPAGVGGIAVIRVSGPKAIENAQKLWKGKALTDLQGYTASFGRLLDTERNGELLDEAVATVFRAPASFTGEDVVELSVHGSRYVQRRLLELLIANGCRLAEAGEFTRRAFANGKMDLAQAEAVADVIASNSRAAHRIAASQMKGAFSSRLNQLRDKLLELASLLELELDFSEEEVEFASRQRLREIAQAIHDEVSRLYKSFSAGSAIKDGIPVAIIGPTNAGKSSLLNLLLGEDRAIVSDIHGTTRDTIEDTLEIGDYLFRFIDTAGLRSTTDPIEALGIERSRQARSRAAIIISVVDATAPETVASLSDTAAADDSATPTILLLNKSDIPGAIAVADVPISQAHYQAIIPFSTKTGQGHQQLLAALTSLADQLRGNTDEDTILVTNLRHAQALKAAAESTTAILDGLRTNLPGDLIAQDLRATIHHLSSITGTLTTPDILASIFSRFCIGK
jgi:tRNA modification GTPase